MKKLEIKTARDIYDVLQDYKAGKKGVGIMAIAEAVNNSEELPKSVKMKFLGQFGGGMFHLDSFKNFKEPVEERYTNLCECCRRVVELLSESDDKVQEARKLLEHELERCG